MFATLLIANRGEIACRIIRTARRLGIATAAVYSDPDEHALHVRLADKAVRLGPAQAAASYLDIDKVLEAARQLDAQAIHPGYGFLSENATFAERCAAAGLVFVGPRPETIRAMGEKQAAIALMREAGVNVLPSSTAEDVTDEELVQAAERIGFPVMVKPNAGGGGKGMHVVDDRKALQGVLESARREASGAFADRHLLIEKYLPNARHIEVQVFADTAGAVVHLFERDCSVQRRHQKVLEETPAPALNETLRVQICEAAVQATGAIAYLGAGTVEFLVQDDAYYFLEMNTRLQVEHPVTELTTGLDLVEWQLRVAAGERLPLGQEQIRQHGHAVEARVYAEDPSRDFLPATGRITRLNVPESNANLRVDAGVQLGDEVGIHYDPLLMKVCAFGDSRRSALSVLGAALMDTELAGVRNNLCLLTSVLGDRDYRDGKLSTGFLAEHLRRRSEQADFELEQLLYATAMFIVASRSRDDPPASPWALGIPWRLHATASENVNLCDSSSTHTVTVEHGKTGYRIVREHDTLPVSVYTINESGIQLRLGKERIEARVARSANTFHVRTARGERELTHEVEHTGSALLLSHDGLRAPLPGTVVRVLVREGDSVERDTALLVLEAMKMEHTITAPKAGVVQRLSLSPGDRVEEGVELVRIAETPD